MEVLYLSFLTVFTVISNMTEKFKSVDENNKIDHVIELITSLQEQNRTIVSQNDTISNDLKEFKLHIQAEVTEIKGNILSIHKEISDVIDSQQFHSKEFECQKVVQESIVAHHSQLDKNNKFLLDKITMLECDLKKEKYDRNHMENNSRKLNVEISGIPMTRGENCKQIAYNLGIKMGHQLLKAGHPDVAHRLMTDPNSNRIPAIIVKSNTRQTETHSTPTGQF